MGISRIVQRAAVKGADKIAKLASLSPAELNKMAELRDDYLSQMPAGDDDYAIEFTGRLLAENSVEIYHAYLKQIDSLYSPIEEAVEFQRPFDAVHNIRFIKINKWVYDSKENNLEKLINVYAVLSNEECNIALIFHRKKLKTDVYLAVSNTKNSASNTDITIYMNRLESALKGNFPGAEWTEIGKGVVPCFDINSHYSVATTTNIPTEKSEKFNSQTIEKLLDGNVPLNRKGEFVLILLATPAKDVEERKLRLAELYSGLSPYSKWTTDYHFNQGDSTNSTATFGINAGVSAGVQNGTSVARGQGQSEMRSQNTAVSEQENTAKTEQKSETLQNTDNISTANSKTEQVSNGKTSTDSEGTSNSIFGSININGGAKLGEIINVGASLTGGGSHGWNQSHSEAISESLTHGMTESITQGTSHSVANTVGQALTSGKTKGMAKSIGNAVTKTFNTTNSISKAVNFGGNFGANFARSSNVTATVGKSEGITQTFVNYSIQHTLEILEQQMKRYEQSVALGMWDFAAYVLSEDPDTSNNVAHTYAALTQGEESYLSQVAINMWRGDNYESNTAKEISKYIFTLRHPKFGLNPYIIDYDRSYSVYPAIVDATTSLSSKELAYSLNFPKKSVVGFPVLECAEFGRSVVKYNEQVDEDANLPLGNVFHMHHEEINSMDISINSLAGHTFITGSTGSGKSNTVYQILSEARKKGIKFLVIEPAKGEYKTVFGNQEDVSVYGTNPSLTPLLKINPFSFPEEIHILEHLDRLVEIFNVCWPMYAAMPAVLKNAVERSYEDCGWNLTTSENEFSRDLYPTFADVARNVKTIIDSSEYDAENKGAYKGSLLTRLQSLSNGINGLIFTTDEIDSEKLFDENVIIDISRVGSTETKSLLMGMLVLKLQEYRLAKTTSFNNYLKHLTVLEEAHNLLKKTSTEQVAESANLTGKSVEMLANAIAEMRTYGEGFIIADQAPGLLDLSVIRNTNTKIIMRLPDETDRIIVGKAANLNDDQITELAKLPRGVAAVYQNEWVQPVLCKVKHYTSNNGKYEFCPTQKRKLDYSFEQRLEIAELLSEGVKLDKEVVLTEVKDQLDNYSLPSSVKVSIYKFLINPPKEPRITKLSTVMASLFPEILSAVSQKIDETSVPAEWTHAALRLLPENIDKTVRNDIVQSILTYQLLIQLNNKQMLEDWGKRGNLQ